eukprot:79866-Prymnesium_polylepis.1
MCTRIPHREGPLRVGWRVSGLGSRTPDVATLLLPWTTTGASQELPGAAFEALAGSSVQCMDAGLPWHQRVAHAGAVP